MRGAAMGGLTAALVAAGCGGDRAQPAQERALPGASTAVERRDLVDRERVAGVLGYAGSAPLTAARAGTLTARVREGRTVRRGQALYELDDEPAAWLLYGETPAWRTLEASVSDGDDVRALERNLAALGYDPGTVDRDWTWLTTAAVRAFERDRGVEDDDGRLSLGEVVFRRGPARIGAAQARLGAVLRPGQEVAELSARRREVEVELDASRQDIARRGEPVTVELPTGATARGRVARVGRVARTTGDRTTITVTIRLRGRAARGTGLDRAPVQVGLVRERRRDVLSVPVRALLARPGGGYALQEAASGRLLPVRVGAFAGDRVEVSGAGIREGLRVGVAE